MIRAKIEKPHVEPVVVPKDPLETAVLLAGIQIPRTHRERGDRDDAKTGESQSRKTRAARVSGLAHLGGPDPQSAMPFFRQALEAGTRDANLCFSYAVMLRGSIPETEYLAALRRATAINPDFSAAQQLLGAYAFNSRDYPEAVTRLHQVKKLDRAQAFMYYRALSYAAFQIGNQEEARSAAARAQQYASTAEEHQFADEITRYVTGTGPATKPPELPREPPPQ